MQLFIPLIRCPPNELTYNCPLVVPTNPGNALTIGWQHANLQVLQDMPQDANPMKSNQMMGEAGGEGDDVIVTSAESETQDVCPPTTL